jgi:hypothetical protein
MHQPVAAASDEEYLNQIISEYLLYNKYLDTYQLFHQQLEQQHQQRQSALSQQEKEDIKKQMIEYLHGGSGESFFSMWDTYVSAPLRTNRDAIRLEFFIRLYLATLNKKKYSLEFKKFLDDKSILLTDSPDLLPFYALPYIPDPSTHPAFTSIYKQEWRLKLLSDVSNLLDIAFEESDNTNNTLSNDVHNTDNKNMPEIYKLVSERQSSTPTAVDASSSYTTSDDVSDMQLILQRTKSECSKYVDSIQERYDELYHVCTDLLRALGGVVKGKKVYQ